MKYATVVLAIAASAIVLGCSDSTSTGPTGPGSAASALGKAGASVVHGAEGFSAKVEGIDEKSGLYVVSGTVKYTIVENTSPVPFLLVETYVESAIEAVNAGDPSFKFAGSMSTRGFMDEKGNASVEVWYPVPDASFNVRMLLNVTKNGLTVSRIWFERGKAVLAS